MPIAGATDLAQLTLTQWGDDTVVTLAMRDPLGVLGDPVSVEQVDGAGVWRAWVPLPTAGTWWQVWTVTGTGAGVYQVEVPVGPAGAGDDPRHTYATTVDLANYLHDVPPTGADRMLKDATALIDAAIMCAWYPVDDDGMPTDPDVTDCLMRATCEQVKWRVATGDDDDVAGLYASVSIGGISLSRAASGRGTTSSIARLGPGVADILYTGGLLGQSPWGL